MRQKGKAQRIGELLVNVAIDGADQSGNGHRPLREPLADRGVDALAVPASIYEGLPPLARRLSRHDAAPLLPRRARDAHKGDCGHVLLVGGDQALTGLQTITIVAALPFVVVMVGLAVSLVKDLRTDPLMVRRRYAAEAVEQAVIAGVTEHGDDFVLAVDRDPEA